MAERKILGDKKKRRYDESLVDKVNAKYATEVVSEQSSIKDDSVAGRVVKADGKKWEPPEDKIIDLSVRRKYDEWLNELKGADKVIMSLPDLYSQFKKLKFNYDHSNVKEVDEDLLKSLKSDLSKGLLTSTLFFRKNGKYGVTHREDFLQAARVENVFDSQVYVPREMSFYVNKEEEAPELFLKGLFDTKDDVKTLLSILNFVSKHIFDIHVHLKFNYWCNDSFKHPIMLHTAQGSLYIEERDDLGVIRVF